MLSLIVYELSCVELRSCQPSGYNKVLFSQIIFMLNYYNYYQIGAVFLNHITLSYLIKIIEILHEREV